MDYQTQSRNNKDISLAQQEIFETHEPNSDNCLNKLIEKSNQLVKEKNNFQKFHEEKMIKSDKKSLNYSQKQFSTTDSYVQSYNRINQKESLSQQNSKFCLNILQLLHNHILSLAFRLPVDPYSEGIPDYYEVIKRPMDLQTIRLKLNRGRYLKVNQFYKDVELIVSNSLFYNRKNQQFIHITHQFQKYFRKIQRLYDAKSIKTRSTKVNKVNKEPKMKFNKAQEDRNNLFNCNLPSTIIQQKNQTKQESFIMNQTQQKLNIFIEKLTQEITFNSSKIENGSQLQTSLVNTNIEGYFGL